MSPPPSDDESKMNDSEKEELLEKIKYWENKYYSVDDKYKTLNQKYEDAMNSKDDTTPKEALLQTSANECKKQQEQIDEALNGLKKLREEVRSGSPAKNKERIEKTDQYLRRNSLLWHKFLIPGNLYGLEFTKKVVEETNKLFPQLEQPLALHHIDDAHRLRTRNKDSNVIIVKYACRWMKSEIYRLRSTLKGSAISITEHLTDNTKQLLQAVRSMVGREQKVYTNNCIINFKFNNRKYTVQSYEDLKFVAGKLGVQAPPPGFPSSQFLATPPIGPPPPFQQFADAGAYGMNYYHQNSMRPNGYPSHRGRGRGY